MVRAMSPPPDSLPESLPVSSDPHAVRSDKLSANAASAVARFEWRFIHPTFLLVQTPAGVACFGGVGSSDGGALRGSRVATHDNRGAEITEAIRRSPMMMLVTLTV